MAIFYTKQAAYDDAVYRARQLLILGNSTAGASGTVGAFTAPRPLTLWGFGGRLVTAGTSTYTTTNITAVTNGVIATTTATQTTATQLTLYRVSGTTTTTSTTTQLLTLGGANNTALASPFAAGGLSLAAGDLVYMLNGTDATAVTQPMYEIELGPNVDIGG